MAEIERTLTPEELTMLGGYAKKLCFGRTVILSDADEITRDNVGAELQLALLPHMSNVSDINYLRNYYLGKQPILGKVKKVREEINEMFVQNRANAIVSFKVGYLAGKPIQYISSSRDEAVSDVVATLNDMMRVAGKSTKDRELVEWQMICGTGYRLAFPKREPDKVPFSLYTLDPRQTFVVYANDYTQRPLCAVNYKTMMPLGSGQNAIGESVFRVYTEREIFTLRDTELVSVEPNELGMIPIIEYPANTARLGAFEIVLDLLDAINALDSGRLDSLRQFVESLLVLYNCDLEEGTTANDIREAGMILLRSIGDRQPEVKVISEVLSQADNETLKDSLIHAVNVIAGMPSQGTGNTGDSSNNGAVVLRDGWQGVETRAEEFEAMFHEPEMSMLRVVSRICSSQSALDFDPSDIDIKFTRRAYEDILSKSQTLVTLLNSPYVSPRDAYSASNLFYDTEEAVLRGLAWYRQRQEEERQNAVSVGSAESTANEDTGTDD